MKGVDIVWDNYQITKAKRLTRNVISVPIMNHA